jgi:hypothetical protein
MDDAGNTWLIDYYYTREGPAVHDLAKLESDVRFVAYRPDESRGRAEAAVAAVRGYAARLLGGDPCSSRAFRIAALRAATNALSFADCDLAQKRAALARAVELAGQI